MITPFYHDINVIFKFRGVAALLVGRRELGARAITHDVYSCPAEGQDVRDAGEEDCCAGCDGQDSSLWYGM